MGLGSPPLRIDIMLESNPLKSIMLVGRLGAITSYDASDKRQRFRARDDAEADRETRFGAARHAMNLYCIYIYIYIIYYYIIVYATHV